MAVTAPKKPASAPGPGKQKKKFAEDSGIAHLLSLSQSITDAKSELDHKRIEDKKVKVKAHQLKKQQSAERKKEKSTATIRPEARAKSKAEIKAELKAQKRDKAKLRKEKRKERAQLDGNDNNAGVKAKTDKKQRKSVSFALA
ncbi:uncharacterized protein UTRI_04135 [Ustilago trichophora]|uniref:Uncharacterized protein n=1 Tax=Ustilago trichophora TaxID=86804 RepID=A0A5C3EAH8_9BASI|nr:uncharacterized protein UTRI_04135 [Ustilago trichophora]